MATRIVLFISYADPIDLKLHQDVLTGVCFPLLLCPIECHSRSQLPTNGLEGFLNIQCYSTKGLCQTRVTASYTESCAKTLIYITQYPKQLALQRCILYFKPILLARLLILKCILETTVEENSQKARISILEQSICLQVYHLNRKNNIYDNCELISNDLFNQHALHPIEVFLEDNMYVKDSVFLNCSNL